MYLICFNGKPNLSHATKKKIFKVQHTTKGLNLPHMPTFIFRCYNSFHCVREISFDEPQ